MPFSPAGISDVQVMANGPDLFISWSVVASTPASTFQVYVDRCLVWSGRAQHCHAPIPHRASGRNVWVEVGSVGPGEVTTDFSSSLTAPGGRTERATLAWLGGTYLDPTGSDDIGAFLIYSGLTPGAAVDYTRPLGRVVAYPGGWINDGFGKGGFGAAGFGRAGTLYQWQSPSLASGTWQFAVVPIDESGNPRGAPTLAAITITAAPRPPALHANMSRLGATYLGSTDGRVLLGWLPSPTS